MGIVLFVITLIFVSFVSTFIHECGHAAGARWSSYHNIVISIGSGKKWFSFRLFMIEWNIYHIFFLGGQTSYESPASYRPLDVALISMMGPLFNGVVVFFVLSFTTIYEYNGLYLFFLFNAWLIFVNIMPIKWKSKQSDGYIALKMIYDHMMIHLRD